MSFSGANVSSDRRNFFMSSAQLEALEHKEALEREPLRQKLGKPIRTGGRILNFELCEEKETTKAVLGLANYTAKIADLSNQNCHKPMVKHKGPVTSVAVLNEKYLYKGSRIALSASWDKLVKIWPVNDPQRVLAVLSGHTDFIKCLVVHPTQPIVYTGSADKSIMLWELPVGNFDTAESIVVEIKPTKIIKGQHSGQVHTLCLDIVNSQILYSAGSDSSVLAWNAIDGSPFKTDNGDHWAIPRGQHKTNIFDIVATENGLWTASADKTAIGWDSETSKVDLVLEHKTAVTSVLPVPQAGIVVTGTRDGIIYIWRTNTELPEIIREIHAHTDDVTCLRKCGSMLYSSGLDETLRVWDINEVVKFTGGMEYIPTELASLANNKKDSVSATSSGTEGKNGSALTEEEERELAELMSDLDDM